MFGLPLLVAGWKLYVESYVFGAWLVGFLGTMAFTHSQVCGASADAILGWVLLCGGVGAVFAWVGWRLHRFALFMTGGLWGALAGLFVSSLLAGEWIDLWDTLYQSATGMSAPFDYLSHGLQSVLVCGVMGGILGGMFALAFEKASVVVTTSLVGAAILVMAFAWGRSQRPDDVALSGPLMALIGLVVAALGVAIQYGLWPETKVKPHAGFLREKTPVADPSGPVRERDEYLLPIGDVRYADGVIVVPLARTFEPLGAVVRMASGYTSVAMSGHMLRIVVGSRQVTAYREGVVEVRQWSAAPFVDDAEVWGPLQDACDALGVVLSEEDGMIVLR